MTACRAAVWTATLAACLALNAAAADPRGTTAAANPPTQPAAAVALGAFEDTPIRPSPRAAAPAGQTEAAKPAGIDVRRVFLSLGIVLTLIVTLRLIAGRFVKRSAGGRASAAIQVVLRTPLSPRQQMVLIRVGRRLVLMTEGGGQNSVVCEISDPDEVAALVGQLQIEAPAPAANPFGAFLGRFTRRPDADAANAETDDSSRFADSDDEPVDPAVAKTRRELDDLVGKVRSVTRQFKPG